MTTSSAAIARGLKTPVPALLSSSNNGLRGQSLRQPKRTSSSSGGSAPPSTLVIRARTEIMRQGVPKEKGTRFASQPVSDKQSQGPKKLKIMGVNEKVAKFREKVSGKPPPSAIKLLSRVEQLRLLSKAEKAGLLSFAENVGLSLSSIEKLGLLSKAESSGALSAAVDPKTPSLLKFAAFGLLLFGPAFVYLVPEDSGPLVLAQVLVALVSVLGGSAAFAASSFVSALQSSD